MGLGFYGSKLSHLGHIMLFWALGHDRSKAPGQPTIVVNKLVTQAIFVASVGEKKIFYL